MPAGFAMLMDTQCVGMAGTEDPVAAVLASAAQVAAGDIVVHAEHGIGVLEGLAAVDVAGGTEEAIVVRYRDGGRLLVPVASVGLLSRYGPGQPRLDTLDSPQWRTRFDRAGREVLRAARRIVGLAARRQITRAPILAAPPELMARFASGAGFVTTPDQQAAIDDVLRDLASGKPMDRIVCGDVGSGKTEVALRAAFAAARSGYQAIVLVPTTLLARQHADLFRRRTAPFDVRVGALSRLDHGAGSTLDALAARDIDIIIGTHALLGTKVMIPRPGLLIVDEEHRFGVRHKDRLKDMAAGLHVLTLTATPIPRTLQQAVSPIRSLSLIRTVPPGRRPVATRIVDVASREIETQLAEQRRRGGGSLYVAPRINDLAAIAARLEAAGFSVAVAHGRSPAAAVTCAIAGLVEGQTNVLVATSIVESGLDLANVDTIVIHRADRFGLAELHQLRGRVGRSDRQAYCLLCVDGEPAPTPQARRRLEVLVRVPSIGAGFAVAAEDLDIRGAGDILGEAQSGHLADVGVELYQTMLATAVAALRRGASLSSIEPAWTPEIEMGMKGALPDDLVADPTERLSLYWRLGHIEDRGAAGALARDLRRRGPLPRETAALLDLALVRGLARRAGVRRLTVGPKGVEIQLRDPDRHRRLTGRPALRDIAWRPSRAGGLFAPLVWPDDVARIKGVKAVLTRLTQARAVRPLR